MTDLIERLRVEIKDHAAEIAGNHAMLKLLREQLSIKQTHIANLNAHIVVLTNERDEWKDASQINERLRIELREQLAACQKELAEMTADRWRSW